MSNKYLRPGITTEITIHLVPVDTVIYAGTAYWRLEFDGTGHKWATKNFDRPFKVPDNSFIYTLRTQERRVSDNTFLDVPYSIQLPLVPSNHVLPTGTPIFELKFYHDGPRFEASTITQPTQVTGEYVYTFERLESQEK